MNKKIDILNQAHQYEIEALQEQAGQSSDLTDLDTEPETPAIIPLSPTVEVDEGLAPPTGRFPLVAATPNGKHAYVVPSASQKEPTNVSSGDEDVFVLPNPVKKKAAPTRRSTRSRKSPALQLAQEGDEDLSVIIVSEPKAKKKMKLRTKTAAADDLEVLEADISFVVPPPKASRK